METGREEGKGGQAARYTGGRDPAQGAETLINLTPVHPSPGHRGHQRTFESSEIAGRPLGRVPFLGEGTLPRGALMVKWRKEARVLQENTTDSDETPAPPPHKRKYRL